MTKQRETGKMERRKKDRLVEVETKEGQREREKEVQRCVPCPPRV